MKKWIVLFVAILITGTLVCKESMFLSDGAVVEVNGYKLIDHTTTQKVIPRTGEPLNVVISYEDSNIVVDWDPVSGAEEYNIYGMATPTATPELLGSTTFSIWTCEDMGSKYFFEVTSIYTPSTIVFVQGGTFQMGDHFSEGNSDEIPLHSVTVSDFYMGETEVTQKEWSDIMGSNPASGFGVGDNYPVYNVSWYAIMVYCNKRSIEEDITPCYTINSSTNPDDWGVIPTSSDSMWNAAECDWSVEGYRMPTEAEWEYAARGGLSGQRFPNGATISHSTNGDTQSNYYGSNSYTYDVSPTAGFHPDYNVSTSPVGSFPPNGYGIYDMSGNLWEWCWDWHDSGYYTTCNNLGSVTDPLGPSGGSNRVLRGGYWTDNAYVCRVTYRSIGAPDGSYSNMGFRVVRTP